MDMVTMETVIQDIASKSLIHLCVWYEDLLAIATYAFNGQFNSVTPSACTSLPAPVAPPHPQPLEDVGGGPVHYKGMDHKGVVHIAEEGNLLRAGEGLDVCSLELRCGLQVVLKLGAAANGSVVHSLGRGRVNTAGILVTPLTPTHTDMHTHTSSIPVRLEKGALRRVARSSFAFLQLFQWLDTSREMMQSFTNVGMCVCVCV